MLPNGQKSLFSAECQKKTNQNLGEQENSHPQEKAFVYSSGRSKSVSIVAKGGFTLFEVSISLAIVAFAVISVLMLFPSGLKMQQQARYQLLAATKALELIEYFSSKPNHERTADYETPEPWDARPFSYTSTRWDMENRISRYDAGVMPVPLDIARRLDSDNNEIGQLLSEGAYLYYADPRAVPGMDLQFQRGDSANETHKLVFAISGYAQNNAIPVFPYKAWPYRAIYPSPPLYGNFSASYMKAQQDFAVAGAFGGNAAVTFEGWTKGLPNPSNPLLANERDPAFQNVFNKAIEYLNGSGVIVNAADIVTRETAATAVRDPMVKAVLKYCSDKFMTLPSPTDFDLYIKASGVTNFDSLAEQYDRYFDGLCRAAEFTPDDRTIDKAAQHNSKGALRAQLALRVQCWRFLAFAMATYQQQRNGEPPPNYSSMTVDGIPISANRLRYYRDRCLYAIMRYSSSFPYDWGAPRPVQRCIMMDTPLLEWDLYSQPRSGNIAGTNPLVKAAMWRPISAQNITSIGLPGIFPGEMVNGTFTNAGSPFYDPTSPVDRRDGKHKLWGNSQNFSLTKDFQASERCRQIVFWSVDWQAYEDAETAPSAPLDASRCPLNGIAAGSNSYNGRLGLKPHPVDGLHFRNPERELIYLKDTKDMNTGSNMKPNMLSSYGDGADLKTRQILSGLYGADRNHNYILDRGTLPKSARQRATLISRYMFYDPRLPTILR